MTSEDIVNVILPSGDLRSMLDKACITVHANHIGSSKHLLLIFKKGTERTRLSRIAWAWLWNVPRLQPPPLEEWDVIVGWIRQIAWDQLKFKETEDGGKASAHVIDQSP